MKFHRTRSTSGEAKVEIQMTPMLDMIFQLLIFFILTFKPVADEGQFGVNMSSLPGGQSALPSVVPGEDHEASASPDIQFIPPIRVQLVTDPNGDLAPGGIVLGDHTVKNMDSLLSEVKSTVHGFPDDYEVIIEADPHLHYHYVVQAVNAISHAGVRKINFGTPATGGL